MICPKCNSDNATVQVVAGAIYKNKQLPSKSVGVCQNCGNYWEIPKNANNAENERTLKKPIYKKWWFWLIIVVIGAQIVNYAGRYNTVRFSETPSKSADELAGAGGQNTHVVDSGITIGQKNALGSAISYIDIMAFSYSGLVKQLEYEGYSSADATYGADNCGADWNEQAAKAAKAYLNMMAFSRDKLIEQLQYEGYTYNQAIHGVEANGY